MPSKWKKYVELGALLKERSLFSKPHVADATVRCRTRSWHVHKAIVCNRNKFFNASLNSKFTVRLSYHQLGLLLLRMMYQESATCDVSLDDDDPMAVHDLLFYLYTLGPPYLNEMVKSDHDQAWNLVVTGDKYDAEPLKEVAFKYLTKFWESTIP